MKRVIALVVIFSFITLIRPVRAFAPAVVLLNPAVLGAVVVAGGVLAGTAAHYSPAVYEAGQAAIDTATTFTRTLYQVEKYALASGADYFVGRLETLALSLGAVGDQVYDWLANHPADVPLLNGALQDSIGAGGFFDAVDNTHPPTISTGGVVQPLYYSGIPPSLSATTISSVKLKIIGTTWTFQNHGCLPPNTYAFATSQGSYGAKFYKFFRDAQPCTGSYSTWDNFSSWSIETEPTTLAPTVPPPSGFDPLVFQTNTQSLIESNGPAIASEIDKIIAANPSAVNGPIPWTPTDTRDAQNIIENEILKNQLNALESAKANDPSNPGLYDPSIAQLQRELDLNSLPATEEPVVEQPDTVYSPSSLAGPYLLPEVDFGARLTEFITTVKTSSLFSLPSSAFTVPGGGSSQLTINGGETFGVHVFDFADMSNLWLVLKSVVLCGFSFVAVRIVCLKGGAQ